MSGFKVRIDGRESAFVVLDKLTAALEARLAATHADLAADRISCTEAKRIVSEVQEDHATVQALMAGLRAHLARFCWKPAAPGHAGTLKGAPEEIAGAVFSMLVFEGRPLSEVRALLDAPKVEGGFGVGNIADAEIAAALKANLEDLGADLAALSGLPNLLKRNAL